ncbi:MAG TPA: radical SAM protein, partial [Ignavibacteria bacterium]
MKALLIYPKYPDTFWSYKHALSFIHKKASLPPLGLLTVSSLLPKTWEKKLVDLNVSELRNEDICDADIVFISSMIVQQNSAREIINKVKFFGKFIVAGGPLFSALYKDFQGVDCFVLNEGEVTIPQFLKDFENGNAKHVYKSAERPDITKTPVPDWSLINMNNYASMSLQVSRGCPYSCDFCDIIVMNGRIPRLKNAGQVIAELDALYNMGWRSGVFIVDDNFTGNRKKVKLILKEIAQWMKKHNKPFSLSTEASITVADDIEIINLLKESNFSGIFVGIETPEEESLKSCGKLQNTGKDLKEKVKFLQRNGLEVKGGFIVGF